MTSFEWNIEFPDYVWTNQHRENESISSFQERFQTEFNLFSGVDKTIVVTTFMEGLKMGNLKESLLNRKTLNLEEVNERAYKYIRIEEAEKMVEKGHGKRPMEETRRRSPMPKTRSGLDRIQAPDRGFSRTDLPRGNEVHNKTWEIRVSQKKARGFYLASTKCIKAHMEVEYLSRKPEEPQDRNMCTLQISEESPKKGPPHEEIRSVLFDEEDPAKVFKIGTTIGVEHEVMLILVLREYCDIFA
ncbi:hypothetical protein LIER_17475 [Lithospermum erythrorhizon]|uniref:Retrotransposon gag domain-containing protein n=1 Tax=Lithospermum erythrorhizon TaxID=34254 RepID=A0AAV3QCU1_LITER